MSYLRIIIFLLTIEVSFAQSVREFKQKHPEAVEMSFGQRHFYLFSEESGWGLYDEDSGGIKVPAHYDLVLPTLEKDLFYIIRGKYAGLYASEQKQELISPERFNNLNMTVDEKNQRYVDYKEKLVERKGNQTFYKTVCHLDYF